MLKPLITFSFLLLALLPDLYLRISFLRGKRLWLRLLHWVPTLAMIVAVAVSRFSDGQYLHHVGLAMLMCVAVPKLCFVLVDLVGRLFPKKAQCGFRWGGGVVALVVVVLSAYSLTAGWQRLEVRQETSVSIPGFEGYRVVQFSDLHVGCFDSVMVRRIVDSINAQHPDIILFTGDLVNEAPSELTPYLALLSQLQAPDGIYAVLGNHDYCTYGRNKAGKAGDYQRQLQDMIRAMGWHLLNNECTPLVRGTDTLALVGVENYDRRAPKNHANLRQALQGTGQYPILLLSHNPEQWPDEVRQYPAILLTLSGHTHAGQIKFGSFSPSCLAYRYWGGLYQEEGQVLYVSLGLGGRFPFRFGAWPEINVITL